ncbi:MAG: hypothetical protein A2269_04645 [Lentisphaerae bacterium RIFOXYA12_FULL_60_10]|nr:MAG: hypothetical protein A2269_04645 [Lentisphaerae bacterium RIFOXYA12_FULL_60_10]
MGAKTQQVMAAILVLLSGWLLSGCQSTAITVKSDPSGATVYSRGSGRMGYVWEDKGVTPVTFPSKFNAQQTLVKWPDGSRSDVRRTDLMGEANVEILFTRPTATPAIKPATP